MSEQDKLLTELLEFIDELAVEERVKDQLKDQVLVLWRITSQNVRNENAVDTFRLERKNRIISELRSEVERLKAELAEAKNSVSVLSELADEHARSKIRDDKTGLFTAMPFNSIVANFFKTNRRAVNCAFGFVDLKNFGKLNKKYGNSVVDEFILRPTARALDTIYETHQPSSKSEEIERRHALRRSPYCVACRYGEASDEFAFFIPEVATRDDCEGFVLRFLRELEKIKVGGEPAGVCADIGISYFQTNPDLIMPKADEFVMRLWLWSGYLQRKAKQAAVRKEAPRLQDHSAVRKMRPEWILQRYPGEVIRS